MSGSAADPGETALGMDGEPVIRRLEALIREYGPDAIVTCPPHGFSNHPDHVRTPLSVLTGSQSWRPTPCSAARCRAARTAADSEAMS